MSVVRDEFSTDDPELAEDMIRQVYLDHQLSIIGRPAEFALSHTSTAVPGPRGFAVNRLHHTLSMRCRAEPVSDLLVTDAPRRGVLQVHRPGHVRGRLHLLDRARHRGKPCGADTAR